MSTGPLKNKLLSLKYLSPTLAGNIENRLSNGVDFLGRSTLTFTSSVTWRSPLYITPESNISIYQQPISLLLVGGGGAGSGANYNGGGGGGGGQAYWVDSINITPGTEYTITVGAGGGVGYDYDGGTNGNDTSAFGYTAKGGGGGGGYSTGGKNGKGLGTGGGASSATGSVAGVAGYNAGGAGYEGIGFDGGARIGVDTGAGGGGAGAAASSATGGAGWKGPGTGGLYSGLYSNTYIQKFNKGNGLFLNTCCFQSVGGGGAGGRSDNYHINDRAYGQDGGGDSNYTYQAGTYVANFGCTAGQAFRGGGGGGSNYYGCNGGSGIVILFFTAYRFPIK